MPKGSDKHETQSRHTVGFSLNNDAQRGALSIYEALLPLTDVNSLGALFTKVLTVFAEDARDHPGINLKLAQQISPADLREFLEWKRQQQGAPEPPRSPPPIPVAPAENNGISVDFDKL